MESQPILCAHLLRKVDAKLMELLRSLAPEEWDKQTIAPRWKVRDVAAHLLDTPLRKLSMVRDHNFVEQVEIRSEQDLVTLINRLNDEGVKVYRRLSPPLLIRYMEIACEQSADFHESLDPFAPAAFAVSWAGESESLNWFDTARELTERWHHQQQIRLATERPDIMIPELYHPVLDCFLRGLPHRFKDVSAPEGTSLVVEISGDCGGTWVLSRTDAGWRIGEGTTVNWAGRVTIPQAIAWRVFTKGIAPEAARAQITVEGENRLAEPVLGLTAIVG
ncbi:MAG TPA: maleylpyruvate isomerase N-terminal domain-containing protein [Terriglobales bacterium]|nr:maleylpyruvate isomerase N-terminal domain-containing protein [Terriglobales bacterium]